VAPRGAARPDPRAGGGPKEDWGGPVFGDLFGEEEDGPPPAGMAGSAFADRLKSASGSTRDPAGSEEARGGELSVPGGPPPHGDDEAVAQEAPSGELEDGAEAEEEPVPEVSDDEVEEFLAELTGKPMVEPVPEGTVPLDPFEKDATKKLDLFRELRGTPNRALLYERGMPDQQMMITLRDRMRMMAQFAEEGNWQRARFLMRGMWRKKRLRLPLGRILWNLMIKAHVRAGRPRAAESWVLDMLDRVYQPDHITYNTLLNGYAKKGDYLKAEAWLRRMRARGVAPDAWSYAAVANAYAEAGSLEGAERTVTAMQESGCKVKTAVPYNAILKVCAHRGQDQVAERWFKAMKRARVYPDRVTYLLLIKACGQAGDTSSAARWLDVMEKAGSSPGPEHFHAVMTAHARSGDIGGVEAWMKVMRDRGLTPDTYSYNIWASAAASKGNTEAAEAVVGMIEAEGFSPDVVTYAAVIGAFAEAREPDGASHWLYRAEHQGLEPDLKCYNQVIKAYARAANSTMAQHFTRRLLRNRLTPDMSTYRELLSAFELDGSPSIAEFWVDHMQRNARWRYTEFPVKQMAGAYSEVLLAHVRVGNLETAEAWLSQMLSEGIEPEARCYIALARRHLEQGHRAEAQRWCERMASWSNLRQPHDLLALVSGKGGGEGGRAALPAAAREREPAAAE